MGVNNKQWPFIGQQLAFYGVLQRAASDANPAPWRTARVSGALGPGGGSTRCSPHQPFICGSYTEFEDDSDEILTVLWYGRYREINFLSGSTAEVLKQSFPVEDR